MHCCMDITDPSSSRTLSLSWRSSGTNVLLWGLGLGLCIDEGFQGPISRNMNMQINAYNPHNSICSWICACVVVTKFLHHALFWGILGLCTLMHAHYDAQKQTWDRGTLMWHQASDQSSHQETVLPFLLSIPVSLPQVCFPGWKECTHSLHAVHSEYHHSPLLLVTRSFVVGLLQVLLPQLEALNADITVLSADTDAEKRKQEASSREVAEVKDKLQQVCSQSQCVSTSCQLLTTIPKRSPDWMQTRPPLIGD